MANKDTSSNPASGGTTEGEKPSKADLQRELEEARESISETVAEIKDVVSEQYESVKDTVTGVIDLRKEFHKEPLVWALGSLSAGFALGYTLGFAHKNTKARGGRQSQVAAFADSLVQELSVVGENMVMPSLNSRIRQLFGFDFSELLEEVGEARKGAAKKPVAKKAVVKKARTKKRSSKTPVRRKT